MSSTNHSREAEKPFYKSKELQEVVLVYSGVAFLTFLLTRFSQSTLGREWVPLGVALLFLWVPLKLARREKGGAERYGIALAGLIDGPTRSQNPVVDLLGALRTAWPKGLREIFFALGVIALVFPPYIAGFYLWHHEVLELPLHNFRWVPPKEPLALLLTQLVVVALPEEAMFRGYVQTRLHDVFCGTRTSPKRYLGVALSLRALSLQALLFALIHVAVDGNIVRLTVFFPGLLFGFVRAKRQGIGAAIVLHALSNVLSETLAENWLRTG